MPEPLRILAIGAHPDDCEIGAAGSAALWAARGCAVKFLSMTGGDNGHPTLAGGALVGRRRRECAVSQERLGLAAYQVLDSHGGELEPSLELRREVVRQIRGWRADVVIVHRPNDYHPDHRYTSTLVQDAAYMVTVPHFVPSVPALERNPLFLYFEDAFERPNPFRPDVAIAIDSVLERKILALDAHESQFYEWDPFMEERATGHPVPVPADPAARRAWLCGRWVAKPISPAKREALRKWYGERAEAVRHAEAFEICEYGRKPSDDELRGLIPTIAIDN